MVMQDKFKHGFSKDERLCSRKEIGRLFDDGNSFFSYPFNLIWNLSDTDLVFPVKIAISVSSRSFKKAVDRNRIKRLIREAWRHEKTNLYTFLRQHNYSLFVMLIYVGTEVPSCGEIKPKLAKLIRNFSLHLEQSMKI